MSIQGTTVKAVGEVPMEQEAAAVVITPDGKRAFVCMNLVNKVGVLSIDGTNVTYDKSLDIPSAFNPYNIDITPDGQLRRVVSYRRAGHQCGCRGQHRYIGCAPARGRHHRARHRRGGLCHFAQWQMGGHTADRGFRREA